ncbi:MAG: TRAP transporter large permease [Desulfobacula sp.]|jgi:tripartite ATP-independent transporter DctM subunit|uniref:TRAP transporter large permease n=2 Tax=Desulfobacula sp. TaxID=2593537 RepID=UPI001D5FE2E5|nr:TRAP transporter large permease [Desulfobacula sp.]MBT3803188.1 TRAP transporter large permease [Desulfobacula sp.]MBT4027466.1 TRAP transporter large permease [Desulfobacula sp.]MBT4200291.1 TRAP transporter large permease [Desulfobacula sp.]MBT4505657.1 TRAP transporter large permease [Desulfobacula sp.]
MEASIIGFAFLLFLILSKVPIPMAMAVVGFIGFGEAINYHASLSMVAQVASEEGMNYGLSVVPLFILMGNFVTQSGLSHELYKSSYAFLGHKKGGLAMATIVACGGFSAVCGSSLATAATMSKVAMPSMRKFGYADSLATGSIAAGGTLGILIPPSVILVIYGLMTETDIGQLFAAGILPGLLGIFCYLCAVAAATKINPKIGPRGEKIPWPDRFRSLKGVWGVLLLFFIVMGGIYAGIFTPTEAAGIGATGAFFFTLFRKKLTLEILKKVLVDSASTTAMIFFLLIGSMIFANFVNVVGMPDALADFVLGWDVSPFVVVLILMLVYVLLGCILESMSMIVLTVPVFYPMIQALGFDLIWFGIVVVVVTEISLITPPVGLNVFVLKAVLPDVKVSTIFKGVTPFWIADIVRLTLIVLFPAISLFLAHMMV